MISKEDYFDINLKRVNCPICSLKQPILRKPLTERQFLYGGWTCKKCGCEMDKFGKKLD